MQKYKMRNKEKKREEEEEEEGVEGKEEIDTMISNMTMRRGKDDHLSCLYNVKQFDSFSYFAYKESKSNQLVQSISILHKVLFLPVFL